MNKIEIVELPGRTVISARGKNKNNVTIGNEVEISLENMRDYRALAKALICLGQSMMKQYESEGEPDE